MSASNDLGQWYKSIPSITRAWFTGSIIVPVAARLSVVNPFYLGLIVNRIIKHFEYPQDFGGAQLLQTPRLLYRYFPSKRIATSRFGTGPIHRHGLDATDNIDNHDRQVFGGRGYVLGFR
ncbi:unnamed protein product [Rotaria sordida]|uniref:Derlin n=1 Tax=Rotaria sordida TaxID=392033 RepID=A0A813VTK9_9BILA|nr:unnamed protein product [Rotaria sordida]